MIELKHVTLRCPRSGSKRAPITHLFSQTWNRWRGGTTSPACRLLERSRYRWPLLDVSLQIESGERVGVVGVNGSGKSSLLRVMAGIYPPFSGTVRNDRRTTALFGNAVGFSMELCATENIRLFGGILGVTRADIEDMIPEILEFAELEPFKHEPLRAYSCGMVARLGFSIGTVVDPEILLLDEVLAVGDARFRKKCEARLTATLDRASTVVVCSHQLSEIRKLCDRVIWLDKGRVVADGAAADVLDRYEHGTADRDAGHTAVRAADALAAAA